MAKVMHKVLLEATKKTFVVISFIAESKWSYYNWQHPMVINPLIHGEGTSMYPPFVQMCSCFDQGCIGQRCFYLWLCGSYERGLTKDLLTILWPMRQIWGPSFWWFQCYWSPYQFQPLNGMVFQSQWQRRLHHIFFYWP